MRVSLSLNFNESLTNDVVSFEQLGTGLPDIRARMSWDFLILTVSASTESESAHFIHVKRHLLLDTTPRFTQTLQI